MGDAAAMSAIQIANWVRDSQEGARAVPLRLHGCKIARKVSRQRGCRHESARTHNHNARPIGRVFATAAWGAREMNSRGKRQTWYHQPGRDFQSEHGAR